MQSLDGEYAASNEDRRASTYAASTSGSAATMAAAGSGLLYPPAERSKIRDSWRHLMRWSRAWRTDKDNGGSVLDCVDKVHLPSSQSQASYCWQGRSGAGLAKLRTCREGTDARPALQVVVFGGGSFGTAMGCALARQKFQLNVTLLLRDPYVCRDINERHVNTRYLKVPVHAFHIHDYSVLLLGLAIF